MGTSQPAWSKYEAAILLDGYLEVLSGKISRKDAVSRVSHDLRQMAVRQGIAIDCIYRNENGIHFQMKSMESAWQGHTVSKLATRLFSEVADLYKNNRHEFGSQKYEGVGGHLFAIAVDKSIQWGYNGVLHGFARNRELVNHYVQTFGAVYLGRLHEYQIAVFEQEARKLLGVYTYEWNGSKENP